MFAGAGQGNITHRYHFVHFHLVFDDGDLREVGVIQTGEDLIDIHFRNTVWRFCQAVVGQIEVQQLHDFRHVLFDTALARLAIQHFPT
ncbi:hypothetical protein D3C80_1638110 [compost metagenome]